MKGCVFWGIQIRISESKNGSWILKIYTLSGFFGSNPSENWVSKLISLERKDYVLKYLGVLTDSNLSWKYHISHVESKISSNIGVIARLRHFTPFITLLNRFRSLIFPYISYGLSAWGPGSQNTSTVEIPLTAISLQWPLSPVPKMAVVERINRN